MRSPDAVLELEDVTVRFGARVVLDRLSLAIPRGNLFGFIGLNGAGKTTSLRVLLGLLAPDAGASRVLGVSSRSVARLGPRLGAQLHGTGVDPWLTCTDNLRAHAIRCGRRGVDCGAALARLGLSHVAHRPAAHVSQGERQRLTLARALLLEPEVIVLDEPLTHLDPGAVQSMLEVLKDHVQRHGATVLLSSHQLEHVERSADHLALIHGGRIVRQGAVSELLAAERSVVIVAAAPGANALAALRASPLVLSAEPIGNGVDAAVPRFRVVLRDADPARLNAALVSSGIAVSELATERRSLDEAFRAITSRPPEPVAERAS